MIEAARPLGAGEIRVEPDDRHNRDLVASVHPPDWVNPAPSGRYDLVVIGGGTAGLACAAEAAALGARVALVERSLMGGHRLIFGCVPSRALSRAARAWHDARSGASFGAAIARGDGDFARAMERVRGLRAELSRNDSAERFRRLGVDVFLGHARFAGRDRIRVDGTMLPFRRAVIATGTRPLLPSIPGLDAVSYRTDETIFALETLPLRLGVVGAGPRGCELAQAFARFGSRVTLIEREARILPREDADAAAVVAHALARDGVDVVTGVSIAAVSSERRTIAVTLAGDAPVEIVTVDELLIVCGRSADLGDLDLDRAAVAYDVGGPRLSRRLRTTNRRIYACGDVTGDHLDPQAAESAARTVLRNALLFGRGRANNLLVPRCTLTDPEIAQVGMNTAGATSARGVTTIDVAFGDIDRARLDGDDEGFLRLHVDRRSGAIVGATVVGERAGEIVGALTLAMNGKLGLVEVDATVHPHPTYVEALKKAAAVWRRTKLTPIRRRALDIMRRLGTRV